MIVDDYQASKECSGEVGGWCFVGFVAMLIFGCILSVAGLV